MGVPAGPLPGRIARVVDGDSIWVDVHIGEDRFGLGVWVPREVRLNGCDAPSHSTPEGRAATATLSTLLPERSDVDVLPVCRDRYGRLVANLVTAGQDVSSLLIAAKVAVAWDGHGAHPVGGGA